MDQAAPRTDWKETITEGEDQRFADYARLVEQIQRDRAQGGAPARAFHAKLLGGVRAEFTVLPDLPQPARSGLFTGPATYPAWVRFSNGDPGRNPDKKGDVRGMAIKVLEVPGKKIIPGLEDARTQDFLMIQTPTMPFHDPDEFLFFVGAAQRPATLLPRLAWHFGLLRTIGILRQFAAGALRPVQSLAALTFWSPAPIQCGAYAARFSACPTTPLQQPPQPSAAPDYLGQDLLQRLKQGPLSYDFRLQFYVDPQKTPIEDAAAPWREEDTPHVVVARLSLLQQDLLGEHGQRQAAYVDGLSFDPWHALVEHRPLGAMMRARNKAYFVSTQQRHAAAEPTGSWPF